MDKQAIRELFDDAIRVCTFTAAASGHYFLLPTREIVDSLRARLDALLAADDWHKLPDLPEEVRS